MFDRIKKAISWKLKVSQQVYIQLFTFLNLALYGGPFFKYFLNSKPFVPEFVFYLLVPLSYLVSMVLLNTIFAIILHGRSIKIVSSLILMANSLCLYLMNTHRIQINSLTIANLFRMDLRLLKDFFSLKLAAQMLYRGLLPTLFITIKVRIKSEPGDWAANIGFGSVSMLIIVLILGPGLYFPSSRTFLLKRNAYTLNYLLPVNYMGSTAYFCGTRIKNIFSRYKSKTIDREAKIKGKILGNGKKNLIVLVIGSSARSQNFSLNGYKRKTNKSLEKLGILSYKNVSSCGTSAAHSIPCIFSYLSRKEFKPLEKAKYRNLLDILRDVGFDVLWRSNAGSCLGLCKRDEYLSTTGLAEDGLDESLIVTLNEDFKKLKKQNTIIVLNQRGSQEPLYKRYPKNFEKFTPSCRSGLGQCSLAELVNSYDNSIYYSSYNLSKILDILKIRASDHNIMLLYVSDHGFGLGENDRWGHSMAYRDAGQYVTRVPMLMWFSNGFKQVFRIDENCLRKKLNSRLSHDNIFHSLLGLFNVESGHYSKSLDIFGSCRIIK
ncbi:MAG: sulfatase-like hydrolase/transferase [Rickettsiales bacterium]|jgi:lipid A ethanolaminephosphotransferase|nr:sulfatase-like hydrolase/transferase [Rickettsiales bacterium]